jgi:hypothetical protein
MEVNFCYAIEVNGCYGTSPSAMEAIACYEKFVVALVVNGCYGKSLAAILVTGQWLQWIGTECYEKSTVAMEL